MEWDEYRKCPVPSYGTKKVQFFHASVFLISYTVKKRLFFTCSFRSIKRKQRLYQNVVLVLKKYLYRKEVCPIGWNDIQNISVPSYPMIRFSKESRPMSLMRWDCPILRGALIHMYIYLHVF
jgi:hypothetical protein